MFSLTFLLSLWVSFFFCIICLSYSKFARYCYNPIPVYLIFTNFISGRCYSYQPQSLEIEKQIDKILLTEGCPSVVGIVNNFTISAYPKKPNKKLRSFLFPLNYWLYLTFIITDYVHRLKSFRTFLFNITTLLWLFTYNIGWMSWLLSFLWV